MEVPVRKCVVDDFNSAVEWSSFSRADTEACVVQGHIMLVLKHSETGGPDAKWKTHVAAAENNARDTMGIQVCDIVDSSAPASLETIRGMIVLGLLGSGNTVIQVDVEAAYLHTDLIGPPHYLEVPRVAWPASWTTSSPVRRPVLRLHRGIPSLQLSGALWHNLADRIVRDHGWLPVRDVAEDVYF